MFYLVPSGYQRLLLAYLKAWVKWIVLLPVVMPAGAAAILVVLLALLGAPAGEISDLVLNILGKAYLSLVTPAIQFWITAYLLAALFFVTGWESARPAAWRLPLLFLLPWYGRLRRMLLAVHILCALFPAPAPAFDRSQFSPPGPPGLTPPALRAGNIPLRE